MCGICGVMYGPGGVDAAEPTPSEAAAIMLRAMLRRGRDATGVMYPGIGARCQLHHVLPAEARYVPGAGPGTRRFQPAHPARHASSRPRVPAPARVSRERPWFLQDDYEFPARSTS
jgi:hypothetical protein